MTERKDHILKNLKPVYLNIRLSYELDKEIEKFAERLELPRPVAIRLILYDTIKKFTYTGRDELYCPYWDQMSEILAILKNIRLRDKLENITGDNKEEIEKIVKEFA